ncbi:MAG TPA: DUF1559 domain-containing protein [Verrucomicrobiae bacterium]
MTIRTIPARRSGVGGFTLVELLTVVAIIGVLTALLLSSLSEAKAQGRNAVCKGHLRQIGLAMTMYLSDYNVYPSSNGPWENKLVPYETGSWTNASWHCPTYVAEGGLIAWQPPPSGGGVVKDWTSYSYNALGMRGFEFLGTSGFSKGPPLGLGTMQWNSLVHDHLVVAPSETCAVADSRPIWDQNAAGFKGGERMQPWLLLPPLLHASYKEGDPPHSQGYNMVFADSHVNLVKRRDYLYPPRSARHWNRDNQPHPEEWSPSSEWAVQD